MHPLTDAWRARANTLQVSGLGQFAAVLETCAAELDAFQPAGRLVTLSEACELCGYTYQHLWNLVRRGVLRNHASGRRILVNTLDLPRKPGR